MFRLLKMLVLSALILSCKDSTDINRGKAFRECPTVTVRFSPNGGVTKSIVDSLSESRQSIRVLAFSFTSEPIAKAIIAAKERGVNVEVVLDRENLKNPNSILKLLHENGVKIYIDSKHAIAHNKVIIIDEVEVFTGSFNFTNSGEERNSENSIDIIDSKIASLYMNNWQLHKDHSNQHDFK